MILHLDVSHRVRYRLLGDLRSLYVETNGTQTLKITELVNDPVEGGPSVSQIESDRFEGDQGLQYSHG